MSPAVEVHRVMCSYLLAILVTRLHSVDYREQSSALLDQLNLH